MSDSKNGSDIFRLSNGEVVFWIADGCVHLKSVTRHGDPVELNFEECKALRDILSRLLKEIE